MDKIKNIAMVAHDSCKLDLLEWAFFNKEFLSHHNIICTGGTGKLLKKVFDDMLILKGGSLGGEQQLGSMISQNKIDVLIFFSDPLSAHASEVDIKAMLRMTVLYNIPTACNRSTADFIISSRLFNREYEIKTKHYSNYIKRKI